MQWKHGRLCAQRQIAGSIQLERQIDDALVIRAYSAYASVEVPCDEGGSRKYLQLPCPKPMLVAVTGDIILEEERGQDL